MRKIVDAGTYQAYGHNVPIAYRGRSDAHNAGRMANVGRYKDANRGTGTEDLYAIMAKYNIKGFEFGNWVTQEERAEYVSSIVSTLEDLFSVLGSRNIGINRNVGVAFGARGSRGAAAHYEPVLNMINLTRYNGAGSLAHEYGHALDYNLGSFLDQHKDHPALSGGRSVAASLPENTGGQLRAYVNQIVDSIRNGKNFAKMEMVNKEAMERGQNPVYSPYWFRRTEVFARFFEQYVCYCLAQNKISNRLLVKQWTHYMSYPVYVDKDDFLKVKPVADKLMKEIARFLNSAKGQRVRATDYPQPVIVKPKPSVKKSDTTKKPNAQTEVGASLLKRFQDIKKQYPKAILLFRVGDFYEAYYDDAKEISKILNISTTTNSSYDDGKCPLAGFPIHALDTYLPKLVRAGKRVAICDTLKGPNESKQSQKSSSSLVSPNSNKTRRAAKSARK